MLGSERIFLAPLRPDDSSVLLRWINDRELVLTSAPFKPVHEPQHRAWFEAVQQRSDGVIFGIRLRDGDALIGYCQLQAIHPVHRTAELQIRIGERAHQGQGLGAEAVRLLVEFGLSDLNLERISLHVLATNARALRLYERVGFVKEGTLREAAWIGGRRVDVIVMGLLRHERAPRPA